MSEVLIYNVAVCHLDVILDYAAERLVVILLEFIVRQADRILFSSSYCGSEGRAHSGS